MTGIILRDQKLFIDGYEITSKMNSCNIDYAAEMKDASVYGTGTRKNVGGLKTVALGASGFMDEDGMPKMFFDKIGFSDVPASVVVNGGAEGDRAYLMRLASAQFSPNMGLGELHAFQISGNGSNPLVSGTLMVSGLKTSTANGTARQLGAVGATQKLHASLHVLSKQGTSPTLDVIIESDSLVGMASAATQVTFAQKTDIGSEYKTADGAIADDWFRIGWTIGGTSTPGFNFVVVVGII